MLGHAVQACEQAAHEVSLSWKLCTCVAVSEKSAINHCPGVKKSPSPVPPPPSPPSPGQGERERDRNRSKSIDAEKRNRKKISEPLDAALQSLRGRKVWTVNQIPRVTGVGSKSQQVEVEFMAAAARRER